MAIQDIQPDEQAGILLLTKGRPTDFPTQICTSYIDITLSRALRRRELQEGYNFLCECSLCKTPPPIDAREALWCPKSCGGMCPLPTEGSFLFSNAQARLLITFIRKPAHSMYEVQGRNQRHGRCSGRYSSRTRRTRQGNCSSEQR